MVEVRGQEVPRDQREGVGSPMMMTGAPPPGTAGTGVAPPIGLTTTPGGAVAKRWGCCGGGAGALGSSPIGMTSGAAVAGAGRGGGSVGGGGGSVGAGGSVGGTAVGGTRV